ncbi:hypothetical protein WR25_04125 [Diploscapter pachys]|uniref:Protein kinase domain-containing protein n=1 Tax=Diploscapter pachys TaxID=2018661 RepID=A0A2A2KTX7_9BILA|nr:hypothetical protein WR25_04125 [Diploscapter pachys]
MFRVLVLLLPVFLFFRQIPTTLSLPDSCECGKLSKCIQSAKILSEGSLQYLQHIDKGPSMIEANLLVNILGIPRHEHDNFVVLPNDSISFDWLPESHDVIESSRSQPLLTHSILLDAAATPMHTTRITVLFDEINMRLRSQYKISIHSIYNAPCNEMVQLEHPGSLKLVLACEKVRGANCQNAIKVDYHPQCNVDMKYSTRVFEADGKGEAEIFVAVNDTHYEGAKYFIAYYGLCDSKTINRYTKKGKCILDMKQATSKRFCPMEKGDCLFGIDRNLTISPLMVGEYGIQLCVVYDPLYEKPPIAYTNTRILAHKVTLASSSLAISSVTPSLHGTILVYASLIILVFILLIAIIVYKCYTGRIRCCRRKKQIDRFVLDEKCLNIHHNHILGSGKFGTVYLAQLSAELHGPVILDDQQRVAVKTPYDSKEARALFMEEVEGAKCVGRHPKLVAIIGTVMSDDFMHFVMEYCHHGNLKEYLAKRRNYMLGLQNRNIDLNAPMANIEGVDFEQVFTVEDIHRIASQACTGMAYLAQNSIIHNALCARHVLITSDHSVKISDFGNITFENNSHKFELPTELTKWTAIEILKGSQPSPKSDVWCFGVLLWELSTVGGSPYHNTDNRNVLSLLEKGFRLPKVDNASLLLYQLMRELWCDSPDDRMTFAQLSSRLSYTIQQDYNASHRFVTIDRFAPYYVDSEEDTKTLPILSVPEPGKNNRRTSNDPAHLLSESERLLGFRR